MTTIALDTAEGVIVTPVRSVIVWNCGCSFKCSYNVIMVCKCEYSGLLVQRDVNMTSKIARNAFVGIELYLEI